MLLDEINSRLPIIVFDYNKRWVYPAKNGYHPEDCLPASFRERDLFIKHFLEKGKTHATFRQYKEIDSAFHGTAKYKKRYGTIELDVHQYNRLLQLNANDLHKAFNELIQLSYIGEKRKNMLHTAERLTRDSLIVIINTLQKELGKILKTDDEL